MFVLKEGRYVAALWIVPLRNARDTHGHFYEHADWLATLYRDEGERDFHCHYRFRYYVDDRAHDSDDKKSAYGVKFTGKTEAEAMAIMGLLAENIAAGPGRRGPRAEIHKLLIGSSDMKLIIERLQTEEFFHMKVLRREKESS